MTPSPHHRSYCQTLWKSLQPPGKQRHFIRRDIVELRDYLLGVQGRHFSSLWARSNSLFQILVSGRSSEFIREGNGTPLQYCCLENPMDRGAWWAAVHGVTKSRTRLSDFPFTFHFHALEKEMATHSSVLAWRIPGTGQPGGLWSMGSHRFGHD